ncbi:hypothetical protein D0Z07_7641 [Hyphodiscus hymeniophilus]|uniref:Heterokaryon incompatibility domain-containing protein n=1 Tax=Hyphodiscus hymeniophilus TaxID=353542 RepID=A0A9P7AUE7_9HELO|nr:hypothetical protein D0Z07_7641 [Hyphodiscus hymeniophilus]
MDKVYALLGLASDGPTIIPRPTYKWPVETVLTGMTRIMLEKKKCLDLITLKLPVSNHAGLPSWVPDWTELDRAIGPGQPSWVSDWTELDRAGPGQERRISSPENEYIHLRFYGNALEVRGRRLHTIDGVTSSIYDGRQITPMTQPSQRGNKQIMSKSQFWALLSMRAFPSGSDKLRLAQTSDICSPDGEQLINQQFPALAAWLQTNKELEMGGKQLGSYFEPVYATPVWAGKTLFGKRRRPLKEWYDDIDDTLWKQPKFSDLGLERFLQWAQGTLEQGLKLVITTRGVVGLAPARTQSNDQVYLIDGCSVPVILRNREGGLEVIGEAHYLSSLKGTEATTTLEESGAKHRLTLI